jgi:hypothetical protein
MRGPSSLGEGLRLPFLVRIHSGRGDSIERCGAPDHSSMAHQRGREDAEESHSVIFRASTAFHR